MARNVVEVRTLKKGKYVMIDDEPCRIVNYTTSSPGKHGSAKARVEAMGVFDDQRRSFIMPVDSKVETPVIQRNNGQLIAMMGNNIQVMDLQDYSTFEMEKPDIQGLAEGVEIEYTEFEGRRQAERVKSQ
jgi:translation initiation factor 5A